MISLKEITWDNFWTLINLTVSDEQKPYIVNNATFIAQAYVNLKSNFPDMVLGIYKDTTPIGFTKIVYVPENTPPYNLEKDVYMIDGFMIDKAHQQKGYGQKAFDHVLNYIKTRPLLDANTIVLLCHEHNLKSQTFFTRFGFKPNGIHKRNDETYTILFRSMD